MIDELSARAGAIEVTDGGDHLLVRLSGEVDADLRAAASGVMLEVIARRLPVVVDAGDVTFIDSSALAFILQMQRVCAEDGHRLVVRNPPVVLVNLLGLTDLTDAVVLEPHGPPHPAAS